MGFSRQEYWSGLPCPPPGDLPNPGIKPKFPALADRFFTTEPPGNSLPVSVLGARTPVLVLSHSICHHGRVPLDLPGLDVWDSVTCEVFSRFEALGAYESVALWVSSSPWETRVQGQEEGNCRHRGACWDARSTPMPWYCRLQSTMLAS